MFHVSRSEAVVGSDLSIMLPCFETIVNDRVGMTLDNRFKGSTKYEDKNTMGVSRGAVIAMSLAINGFYRLVIHGRQSQISAFAVGSVSR